MVLKEGLNGHTYRVLSIQIELNWSVGRKHSQSDRRQSNYYIK